MKYDPLNIDKDSEEEKNMDTNGPKKTEDTNFKSMNTVKIRDLNTKKQLYDIKDRN